MTFVKLFGKKMGGATAGSRVTREALAEATLRKGAQPSDLQLRATFDHAAVGIAHTAPDGTYLRVNRKLCDMLGYEPEELVGRTYKDITFADDRGVRPTLRSRLTDNPDPAAALQLEKRYVRKDGSTIWASVSISLVRNSAGAPDYFVSIVQDISDRKAAEERFRATFEQAAVGIAHTGLDGRYLQVNRKVCEMLGYRVEEMLVLNVDAHMGDEEREVDSRLRGELLEGRRESFSYEGRYLHQNGTALWVNQTVSLARDAAHNPVYLIRVVEDITTRKRTEERLQQLNRAQRMSSECRRALARSYDEGELLDALCRIVVETGSYRQAWIGFAVDDAHKTIRVAAYAGFEDTTPRVDGASWGEYRNPQYHGVMGEVIASGQRRLVQHIADDPAHISRRARALERGYESSLTLPLWNDQRCYGAIAIYARAADAFDNAELKLLEELTDDISRGITVLRDKRAREEAEAASRQHELHFKHTFDQAAVGISHASLDGRYLAVNKKFCDMLGYRPDELAGQPESIVSHPDDNGIGRPLLQEMLDGKLDTYAQERRYRCKDGRAIWVNRTDSLARDEDGQPLYLIRVIEDISERKRIEAALRESEEHFRLIVGHAGVGITQVSLDERYLLVNDKFMEITGYGRDELMAMTTREIIGPSDYEQAAALRARLLRGEIEIIHAEMRIRHKNGGQVWVNVSTSLVRNERREPRHFVSVVELISERKQTEAALYESETQFRQLAENIPEMFWITDVAHRALVYLSPAFETITGHKVAEAKASSRTLVAVVHPDDRRRVQMARKHAAEGGYDETYRLVRPDGSTRWVRDRAFPIRDPDGQVYRVAGIAEDITERKHAEQTMVHLAHYDALTKLPNRVLCQDRLKQALAHAKRNGWNAAVMFVDLDRFKNVNDTLGHHVGDTLLQQASERLTKCVRAGDTVARFGGDEYVVIMSDLSGAPDAAIVAQKISNAFATPFVLDGKQIYITASIGISMYPNDSKDHDDLIRNADTAMYCAKELGRNNFQFYEPSMNARALEKLDLENDLRRAFEHNEFRLHYQPKASLATGQITGCEALLRWQHPERGLVSPGEFIPLLEETGLIVPAGEWVIREACRQIRAWQDAGIRAVPIAVNLAARQFQSADLGATIVGMLAEFGIEPRLLEMEITESSLMQNTTQAVETLKYLQSHGLLTSIDDFGTGYSSLGYLKRFPLHALKIDRTFVRDIGEDSDDTAITLALINMAHNLGLKVIAEGVETEAQLSFLAAHGCDEMQGYYFSKPLTDVDVTTFLEQKRALPQNKSGGLTRDTILLVDDDEDTLMLIQRVLRDDDYDVLIANNAEQGLDLLAKHNVKVVVSDQQMPGMNGVAFMQRVKSAFPATMRIMLSAHTEFETVADAFNKGEIYRFVPKSAEKEELRRAIREALDTAERLNRSRTVALKEKR